jgi:capsular exopolysaccharide synthesis family protein
LTGRVPVKDTIQKTSHENIWIITSGPIPPNPAELLNSDRMKELLEDMKKKFDVILLDTPPILAVVDALIVSALSDSMVFIIRAGKTTRMPFLRAVEELNYRSGVQRSEGQRERILFPVLPLLPNRLLWR